MTITAFFIILVSAFMHAGWNFLSKKTMPSIAFYCLSSTTAAIFWLPWMLLLSPDLRILPLGFWLFLLVSIGFEFCYFLGLANAYRRGDISMVYPLARALPVLLTALVTMLFQLGEPLSALALFGMGVLFCGCFIMPLNSIRGTNLKSYRNSAMLFILLAALGTTGYTIIDSQAMALIRDFPELKSNGFRIPIVFIFLLESGIAALMAIYIRCSKREQRDFRAIFMKTSTPFISGIFSSSAYVLVLIAMGLVSNVSYIQAFRQMSLPMGVLAGIFLLHERPGIPRLTGIALAILGLVLVALG